MLPGKIDHISIKKLDTAISTIYLFERIARSIHMPKPDQKISVEKVVGLIIYVMIIKIHRWAVEGQESHLD